MSFEEYEDLFIKAQQKGLYRLYTFDIVCSRKLNRNNVEGIYSSCRRLINNVYLKLEILELKTFKQILHRNPDFFSCAELHSCNNQNKHLKLYMMEPFHLLGDLFGLTVLRNSISSQYIYDLFVEEKKKLGLDIQFHCNNGYYETDDWNQGAKYYFRGYCIGKLEAESKKHNQNEKIKIL